MKDPDLLAALKRGDERALEEIISVYGGYVMAVVQHTICSSASEQDKEELVSDVFVALWNNAGSLKPDSHLKAWLARVARNAALNKVRSLHPTEELQEDFIVTDGAATATQIEKAEQARLIRAVVDGLEEEDRTLFLRHYFWHQSIPAIAEDTGMNPSTIKSHLFRGRQKLKTALMQKGYTA